MVLYFPLKEPPVISHSWGAVDTVAHPRARQATGPGDQWETLRLSQMATKAVGRKWRTCALRLFPVSSRWPRANYEVESTGTGMRTEIRPSFHPQREGIWHFHPRNGRLRFVNSWPNSQSECSDSHSGRLCTRNRVFFWGEWRGPGQGREPRMGPQIPKTARFGGP
jgi:hypothetical protein